MHKKLCGIATAKVCIPFMQRTRRTRACWKFKAAGRLPNRLMCGCIVTQRTLANRASVYKAGWYSGWYFTLRFLKPQHGAARHCATPSLRRFKLFARASERARETAHDISLIALTACLVHWISGREKYSCIGDACALHTRWKTFPANSVKKGSRSSFYFEILFSIYRFFFVARTGTSSTVYASLRYIPCRLKLPRYPLFHTNFCLSHSRRQRKKEQDLMPNVSR